MLAQHNALHDALRPCSCRMLIFYPKQIQNSETIGVGQLLALSLSQHGRQSGTNAALNFPHVHFHNMVQAHSAPRGQGSRHAGWSRSRRASLAIFVSMGHAHCGGCGSLRSFACTQTHLEELNRTVFLHSSYSLRKAGKREKVTVKQDMYRLGELESTTHE